MTPAAESAPRRGRRQRGSLSREEILLAARGIVERDGLRQLSMPALAEQLGSGVTSIYWYFHNKVELVDALAEQVLGDVHQQLPPAGDGPWETELVGYFVAFRGLLQSLPAYREVVAYAPSSIAHSALTRAAQRRLDEGLHLLMRAGLSRAAAFDAFAACLNFTRGFVVLEHGIQTREDAEPSTRSSRSERDEEIAALNQLGEQRFVHGLQLLVAGIRVQAESTALPPVTSG